MNISRTKKRTPLGVELFKLPAYERDRIRTKLTEVGLTEGGWRSIYERTDAHLLPVFVRDIIVKEMPAAEKFFKHPKLAEACSSQLEPSQ